MKKFKNKKLLTSILTIIGVCTYNMPVYATSISDNTLAIGLQNLLTDLSKWIAGISGVVGIAMISVLLVKKQFFCDDEMEAKQLNKKAIGVGITTVVILGLSVIFNVVLSYFSVGTSI